MNENEHWYCHVRPHPVGKAGQLIQFFPPPPPSMLGFVSLLGGVVFVCCWLLLFRKVSSARYLRSLPVRALRARQLGRGWARTRNLLVLPFGSIQSPDALRSMSNNYWFGCSTPEFLSGFALARVVPRSSAPTTPPRIAFFPRRRATDQRLGMVGSGKETYDSLARARRGGMFLSRP